MRTLNLKHIGLATIIGLLVAIFASTVNAHPPAGGCHDHWRTPVDAWNRPIGPSEHVARHCPALGQRHVPPHVVIIGPEVDGSPHRWRLRKLYRHRGCGTNIRAPEVGGYVHFPC